jgi:hypothetical protein
LSELGRPEAEINENLIRESIKSGDILRITTHGDIVRICDEGIVKITEVRSSSWFPNQLVE